MDEQNQCVIQRFAYTSIVKTHKSDYTSPGGFGLDHKITFNVETHGKRIDHIQLYKHYVHTNK